MKWNYICILIDLFNSEIIGYSAGSNKTAGLVNQAFQTVTGDLRDMSIFHTDRGNEFKNHLIDETLEAFKIIKTEFVRNQGFCNLHQLQIQLSDYVNWFNNHSIHSSLNYLTPVEYRVNTLKKEVV